MLKYVNYEVTFSEIPDEISLCINISNCPNNCPGCHSAYLKEDIGTPLTLLEVSELINKNKGISCVAFLGGDSDPEHINSLAIWVKADFPKLKVAWYSGSTSLSPKIQMPNFDYIKLGPYDEKLGPLTSKTTNQIFFKIEQVDGRSFVTDITSKFWKDVHTVDSLQQ